MYVCIYMYSYIYIYIYFCKKKQRNQSQRIINLFFLNFQMKLSKEIKEVRTSNYI